MSGIKSFLLAIDMATRERDRASQGLMRVRDAHLFAQEQMTQLQGYAEETESRWTAAAQTSTTPELMRHHYQFMERLQHAIGLQKVVLENSGRKVDAARQLVLEAEFRLLGLKQMVNKKQADVAALQARREQKQTDEFAAQQTRQSTSGYFGGERS